MIPYLDYIENYDILAILYCFSFFRAAVPQTVLRNSLPHISGV